MSGPPSHNFFIAVLAILLALSPFISLGVSYAPNEFAAAANELLNPETLLKFIGDQFRTSIENLPQSAPTGSPPSELRFDDSSPTTPSQKFEFKRDFNIQIKGEGTGDGDVIHFMRSAIQFIRAILDAFEKFLNTFERLFKSQ